jgi:hypothetical protein
LVEADIIRVEGKKLAEQRNALNGLAKIHMAYGLHVQHILVAGGNDAALGKIRQSSSNVTAAIALKPSQVVRVDIPAQQQYLIGKRGAVARGGGWE